MTKFQQVNSHESENSSGDNIYEFGTLPVEEGSLSNDYKKYCKGSCYNIILIIFSMFTALLTIFTFFYVLLTILSINYYSTYYTENSPQHHTGALTEFSREEFPGNSPTMQQNDYTETELFLSLIALFILLAVGVFFDGAIKRYIHSTHFLEKNISVPLFVGMMILPEFIIFKIIILDSTLIASASLYHPSPYSMPTIYPFFIMYPIFSMFGLIYVRIKKS